MSWTTRALSSWKLLMVRSFFLAELRSLQTKDELFFRLFSVSSADKNSCLSEGVCYCHSHVQEYCMHWSSVTLCAFQTISDVDLYTYIPDLSVNHSVDSFRITLIQCVRRALNDYIWSRREFLLLFAFLFEFFSMTNTLAVSDTVWLQLRIAVSSSSTVIAGQSSRWISRRF